MLRSRRVASRQVTTPESLLTSIELDEVAAQLEIQSRIAELLGAKQASSQATAATDMFERPVINAPAESGTIRLLASFDGHDYERPVALEHDARDYNMCILTNGYALNEIELMRRGLLQLGERSMTNKVPEATQCLIIDQYNQDGKRSREHNRLTSPQLLDMLRTYDNEHFRSAAGIETAYQGPVFEDIRQKVPELIVGAYAMHAARYPDAFGPRHIT